MKVFRIVVVFLLCTSGFGQWIERRIPDVQHLRRAEGIVRDHQGNPMSGVVVEVRRRDSKELLKSEETHLDGHFSFRHLPGGDYDLRFGANGWDSLLYRVHIDKSGSQELWIVTMHIAA